MPDSVSTSSGQSSPIRVMIIDDSIVVRGFVTRWLRSEEGIEVVASHSSARRALDDLEQADPDIVLLDVEMPDMDGITALPLLRAKKPHLPIVIVSTVTRRNAEISMHCLSLGAVDCLAKPQSSTDTNTAADFRRELISRVRTLGVRKPGRPRPRRAPAAAQADSSAAKPAETLPRPEPLHRSSEPMTLRPFALIPPRVLLIGSSTGGPQALADLLGGLRSIVARVPVLITQHMPPSFTTILAEHLSRVAGVPAHEPVDGEPIKAGTIYVAPGGKHMLVASKDRKEITAVLTDDPPVNYCKPAVDPLFQSAVPIWGNAACAVVLTGMGSDGARGALTVAEAGGSVIAQDEATSVVWGMPGATAHIGACSAVLPLPDIAPRLVRLFGERS
jgi:two-component system chemotaxis response regulator CheB